MTFTGLDVILLTAEPLAPLPDWPQMAWAAMIYWGQ